MSGSSISRFVPAMTCLRPIRYFLQARPTFRVRAGYRDRRLACWAGQNNASTPAPEPTSPMMSMVVS